jgi:hypothetical protein
VLCLVDFRKESHQKSFRPKTTAEMVSENTTHHYKEVNQRRVGIIPSKRNRSSTAQGAVN